MLTAAPATITCPLVGAGNSCNRYRSLISETEDRLVRKLARGAPAVLIWLSARRFSMISGSTRGSVLQYARWHELYARADG